MKVEVKKIDELKRELRFEVSRDRVAKAKEDVYKELAKTAKVKGFREGKVPRNILETHYGRLAQEETIKKVIPEAYQEGIDQEEINPVDLPEIHDVSYKEGTINFIAKLEVRPEIDIKSYKGVSVKRKDPAVTDEEIDKAIEYMKKGQGEDKEVSLDDNFARGLGYPDLVTFKNTLRKQMELDKDRHNRIDIENQIVEQLIKKTKFSVPESFVRKQLDRRVAEVSQRMKSQGHSEEEIKKKHGQMRIDLRESVEKDIKVYLIFDKIAKLEEMKISEGENISAKVMEFLLKEASWEK